MYLSQALYPKQQPDPPQLAGAVWPVATAQRAVASGEEPLQPNSSPGTQPLAGARGRAPPYQAEVHAVGDGVSPVFCTAPWMPPRVPSSQVAAFSSALPSSLSITT